MRKNKIYYQGDGAGWVLDEEAKAVKNLEPYLKINFDNSVFNLFTPIYFGSKYKAINYNKIALRLRRATAFDYFHGDPSISPAFYPIYKKLISKKNYYTNIRVSHSGIERLLHEDGFGDSVIKIPIGVDCRLFTPASHSERIRMRNKYGIPIHSVVIGSFQKDGNGWGLGNDPKLIKGPDIFLNTMSILKSRVDNLFVLLSGPARGYMKNGLSRLKIPFKHIHLTEYHLIPELYKAIDLYLVTSREEGGPKAVLEAMASGVILVSTPVGQAVDMVINNQNGYISEGFNPEELSELVIAGLGASDAQVIRETALSTAEENTYINLLPLWKSFFERMINR